MRISSPCFSSHRPSFFFLNDPATTEIYTLSLHDALPILPGEPPRVTAERELLEEAGYRARDWHELVDFFSSPGITTERLRVFLARGLTWVPESERGGHVPEHEEAHLLVRWLPLRQAVRLILAGDLHNGVTAV